MRVLSLNGSWSIRQIDDLPEVLAKIESDRLTWVRAGQMTPAAFAALAEAFGIHPLAVEDIQNPRQRPKVEDFEDMTFVIVRVPRLVDDHLTWEQVGLFLGEDFLITASARNVPELDVVEKHVLAKGLPKDRMTSCTLFHHALDALVDAWFPFMDEMEDHIEALEERASATPDQHLLAEIRDMKQEISKTRKVSSPMREAMLSLERSEHPHIHAETRIYIRDVSDHMVRLNERLEHVKEMALIAQETWNATLANQQNTVMKRLTVVAGLLLFPGLIAGLGGMNFERGFPDWGYWEVTGGILAFIAGGFSIAAWKKWI